MDETEVRIRLEEHVIRYRERFYRLAYSYVGSREDALDVVQNAIVKGLENCGSIRKPEYMETWFYRVLLNECYGLLRKSGREISFEPESVSRMQEGTNEADREPDYSELYEQILGLPDKMKTVILLRFYEELTLEEISRVTGSSLSAVKYRLYAGLKRLERVCGEVSL